MKRYFFAITAVIWMFMIFTLSSMPADQLGPDTGIVNFFKKIGHVLIFGVLATLYLWSFKGGKSLAETSLPRFALSFILTVLYAFSDEYHQSFTPGRHAAVKDVVIDACGAIIFLGSLYGVQSRRKRTP